MTRPGRLPLYLAVVATGVVAGLVAGRVAGATWLPAPWDLVLAALALGAALTAGRAARHAPRPDREEDPFAFLDAVQTETVVTVPPRRRVWPVLRGVLAGIGALTVAGALVLALTPGGRRRLDGLMGVTVCQTLPARTREVGRLVARPHLVHFDGARPPGPRAP